jgi:hypothetical protein
VIRSTGAGLSFTVPVTLSWGADASIAVLVMLLQSPGSWSAAAVGSGLPAAETTQLLGESPAI